MKNKKLAVLLLAIVTAFTMVMAIACQTASGLQSGSESSFVEESTPNESIPEDSGNSSVEDEPIAELLQSIPASNLKFAATPEMGDSAESSWFVVYGESALEITVYVVDSKIYTPSGDYGIYSSDAISVQIAKNENVQGYTAGAISILVDAAGRMEVKNLSANAVVAEHGITAEVVEFTFTNETVDGYYVQLSVPYTAIEASKDAKDAVIYPSMVNAYNSAIRAESTPEGYGLNAEKVSTWIVVADDNTFSINENLYDVIDVLFIGDSYIDKAFWNREFELNYDQLVARYEIEAVNLGVGGTKIEYWEAQLEALSLTYAPANIVIHIGVNDINDGRQDADATVQELQALYNNYHTAFPTAKINWVSLIPNTMFAQNNDTYATVNKAIEAWGEGKEWFNYVDVFSYFTGSDSTETHVTARANMFLVNEGLHLNCEYGYPLWGAVIMAELGYGREHGSVMGDNVSGNLYHSDGWTLDSNGVLAENTGKWEKAIWYNGFGPSEDVYFETDLLAPGLTHADEWPKVGLVLRNDDVTVFAYFDLHDAAAGTVSIVYRPNGIGANGWTVCQDWMWNNQSAPYNTGININNQYARVGISKLNDTVYMYIDGKPVTSLKVPGLTADSKVVAGVMGFNYHMLVKNATGTNDEAAVAATLLQPHSIHIGEYEGATITLDKTSAKKGETVSFTIESESLVTSVLVNGEAVEAVNGVYSFVMPDENVNIVVAFAGKLSVNLSAVDGKVIASTLVPYEGDTVTFTAAEGYHIASLYVNGEAVDAVEGVYSIVANEDLVVTAEIFEKYDGIILDGAIDAAYGSVATVAEYSDNRTITLRGAKTANGVVIHAVAVMNNCNTNQTGDWSTVANFEFRLNAGAQRYVNVNGASYGVAAHNWNITTNADGKYVITIELYVLGETIATWAQSEEIQVNYAWKSPGETGYVVGNFVNFWAYRDKWTGDWFASHLGGLDIGANDFTVGLDNYGLWADNLRLTESGLKIGYDASEAVIDGNLEEYAGLAVREGDHQDDSSLTLTGKAGSDGLYLAITIKHEGRSAVDNNDWWNNDNLEFNINEMYNQQNVILIKEGKLIHSAYWDKAAMITTGEEGDYTTTIELYAAGVAKVYKVFVGINGTGFNGWQPLGTDVYITPNGVSLEAPTYAAQANLDGILDDAIWTEEVLAKAHTATANGATVTMVGVSSDYGVHMAFTVKHAKALDQACQGDGTQWWNFMGPEVRLGGVHYQQIACGAWGNTAINCLMGYTSSTNEDGSYTTVYEIFVPYFVFQGSGHRVAVVVGGVFETGFTRLWGAYDWTSRTFDQTTHYITPNGIIVAEQ